MKKLLAALLFVAGFASAQEVTYPPSTGGGSSSGSSTLTNGQVQVTNLASGIMYATNGAGYNIDVPAQTGVWFKVASININSPTTVSMISVRLTGSSGSDATKMLLEYSPSAVSQSGRRINVLYYDGRATNGFGGVGTDGSSIYVQVTNTSHSVMSSFTLKTSAWSFESGSQPATITAITTNSITAVTASSISYMTPGNGIRYEAGAFDSLTLGGSNVMTSASGGGGGAFAFTGTNNIVPTNAVNFLELDDIGVTIGGGENNGATNANFSTINGGQGNFIGISSTHGSIGGGSTNYIGDTAAYATIGGGRNNAVAANATHATVAGGWLNVATGILSTISGGGSNSIGNAGSANIAGGAANVIGENGYVASIGGGLFNTNNGGASVIGGGAFNCIVNSSSSADGTVIGGGSENIAGGEGSTIAGGWQNLISGSAAQFSTIAGGYLNTIGASASFGVIPGGRENNIAASALYAFAAGYKASADHNSAFVWADNQGAAFSSTATNQFLIRASGGVGINTNAPGTYALSVNGTIAGLPTFVSMGMPNGLVLAVSTALAPVTNFNSISSVGFGTNLVAGTCTIPMDGYYQINHGMSAMSGGAAKDFQIVMTSNGTAIAGTRLVFTTANATYEVGRGLFNLWLTNGTIIGQSAAVLSGTDTLTFTNASININRLN